MSLRPELLHPAGPPKSESGSRSARTDREPGSSRERDEKCDCTAPGNLSGVRGLEGAPHEHELSRFGRLERDAARDPRAPLLEKISETLREPVTDVVRRGDDWEISFSIGDRVVLEGSEGLLSPRRVEAAVVRCRPNVLSLGTRERWKETAQAIASAARVESSISEEEETLGWVRMCVDFQTDLNGQTSDARERERLRLERARRFSQKGGQPGWREGEEILVRIELLVWELAERNVRIRLRELAARLGRYGFTKEHRGVRIDGKLSRARVWVAERCLIADESFEDFELDEMLIEP